MKISLFFLVSIAMLFSGCEDKPTNGELTEAQKQEKRDAFYSNRIKTNPNDDVPAP